MSLNLFIRDVEGERRIEAERLPLRVGTGSDCELRLPGPGGGPVMMLDLLDDVPFVQPAGRDESMAVNGEPLVASTDNFGMSGKQPSHPRLLDWLAGERP